MITLAQMFLFLSILTLLLALAAWRSKDDDFDA